VSFYFTFLELNCAQKFVFCSFWLAFLFGIEQFTFSALTGRTSSAYLTADFESDQPPAMSMICLMV
jgi:hypothetical protein